MSPAQAGRNASKRRDATPAARGRRRRPGPRAPRLDGVALSLYQGLFAACAEEMGAALMRAAHSPNITERLDHSCALFDARGRLVAQAAHIPVHLGSMPRAVEAAMTRGPFLPGDAILLNDPFAGGTHLPDLTLVSPVFLAGSRRPGFYVASRAHHADVGGAAPGSLPLAREVYEEGVRIPPVFVRRGERVDPDVLALLLANVRTPEERRADLAAQLGAQTTGARRLAELARRSGAEELRAAARALQHSTERRARAALATLPRGRWRFADVLDDDGLGTRDLRIAAELTLDGHRARLDFRGTAPQARGPVNAVLAVTRAASLYALRCVLAEDLPVNDGLLRVLEVIAPAGSLVNPRPPAAVGAGNVETSQRIVDVALGCFARALPGRVPAASSGTMNNLLIGGEDPRTRAPFAYYETLGGGHGAGPGWDGASAMQAHMTNTRNTPVEALEHACPVRVLAARVRRGSGGKGRWRGGDGIERTLELLADARVTVIAERRARGPYGLAGGSPGAPGRTRVRRGGRLETLPGKCTLDLARGDVLILASPGGGGWGRESRREAGREAGRRRRLSRDGRARARRSAARRRGA
ncbi:MAG TPA: hydantoinase B/oxoprolinase family protein [Candidatus Acidoferrales bacterium]|nr:hydantoinase B/oxoprolinase family protein [Candidatus Acidoferrales bacterium]